MNRQQRRQKERQKKHNSGMRFTEEEVKEYCTTSYRMGVEVASKAAKEVLGLGDVRMQRILDKLEEIELKELNRLVDEARKGKLDMVR